MILELDPKDVGREMLFNLCKTSPMPMISMTKQIDVTKIKKLSGRKNIKFNTLMCYCIGLAAVGLDVFMTMPRGDKFYRYDKLVISAVVDCEGGFDLCGFEFSSDFETFKKTYETNTNIVRETGREYGLSDDAARVGTSCIVETYFDSFTNCYFPELSNPFLLWGKYRKTFFGKIMLPMSLQVNHAQMDGGDEAKFFNRLQDIINNLKL